MSTHPTQTALIFDVGGVLLNWSPYGVYLPFFNGDKDAVDRFLAEIGFYAWNVRMDKDWTFAQGVAALSAQFPQHAELIRAWDERWPMAINSAIQGTVDILAELKAKGHAVHCLSNWSDEKYRLTRPRFEFFEWFGEIVISGQIGLLKPDPRIFTYTLDKIQRTAAECIFVDDVYENVLGARSVGLDAIHFQSPEQLRAELNQRNIIFS